VREEDLKRILPLVEKPARYLATEFNPWRKNPAGLLNLCWCFPDTYEIGMSHLGGRLIYDRLNQNELSACDRAFLPWPDMQKELKKRDEPLYSLEQLRPLNRFDVLAITLSYELSYSNLLALLELSGIPLLAKERRGVANLPLIIVGGPGVLNPEPIADFVDAAFIGESEDFLDELVGVLADCKKEDGLDREKAIAGLGELCGVYLPDNIPLEAEPETGWLVPVDSAPVVERRVAQLSPYIERPLVPSADVVHSRVTLEVMRGCTGGCRFCQAGMAYRPVRSLSAEEAWDEMNRQLELTGYSEATVSSLSSTDWHGLAELIRRVLTESGKYAPLINFPSLRVGEAVIQIQSLLSGRRLGSLTIAPEAGSERLRAVINKSVFTNEEVVNLAGRIFEAGFTTIKLYFMFGLPTETDDDLDGLIRLARQCAAKAGKKQAVKVALSPFIPKPYTPFQWVAQVSQEELGRRLDYLRRGLEHRKINIRWNSSRMAFVEAALSRGDRRIGKAILEAHQRGAMFDAWDEFFDLHLWQKSFAAAGLSLEEYANRELPTASRLPWAAVNNLVSHRFLAAEYERSLSGETEPDCRHSGCNACGINPADCELDTLGTLDDELARLALYPPEPNTPQPPLKVKVRFKFSKHWPASLLSHLELQKVLTHSLRRAGYTMRLSSGFNPRPQISLAMALPLGVESRGEIVEVELANWFDVDLFLERINETLPEGLEVLGAVELLTGAPKLSQCARLADFIASFKYPPQDFAQRINEVLTAKELFVERIKKETIKRMEVRDSLKSLRLVGGLLQFSLWYEPSIPSLRVDELFGTVLGIPVEEQPTVIRTAIHGVGFRGNKHDLLSPAMTKPHWKGGMVKKAPKKKSKKR